MEKLLKWKRERPGRQISTDGRFACESDGYTKGSIGFYDRGEWIKAGDGGEWAAILIETDENLDWYPTLREAKERCEDYARWGR
jgi:hypothetical protein